VLLATSKVPRVSRRYRGRDVHEWAVELGVYDQPAEAVTDPAEGPEPGLERSPESLDIQAERLAVVLWCTGFGPDTGWLHVPVLMPDGTPAHARGVTAFPGLYVAGYLWLSNRGSGLLYGVAADALDAPGHALDVRRHDGDGENCGGYGAMIAGRH
jgi:hypothetical protein